MDKLRRTPGPWYLSETGIAILGHDTSGYSHVPVATTSPKNLRTWRKGDAQLIAAAPELLEALEKAIQHFDAHDIFDDSAAVLDEMKAAVAKARGEAK